MLIPNWSASLHWTITREPPAIAQISQPEPSSVSGPRPLIARAKMAGNMMEWKKPTAIRPYMAVGPWARLAIIMTTNAPMANAASTFSGAIARMTNAPRKRPTAMPPHTNIK